MIAGETENILDQHEDAYYEYDELFGLGGKGRARRQARKANRVPSRTREEKQERRKAFFQGIGSKFKENGGIEGVSSTVGNVLGLFKNKDTTPTEGAGYQLAVGNTPQGENNKKMTLGMYVVGGAVVVGLVVLGVTKMSKNKAAQ